MKTVAWLAGIGTMLAAAAYMVVSLNRWEWNRALFFGLILLIAEVALATALVLRKLGQLERRGRSDDGVLDIVQGGRPSSPDRFGWLKDSAKAADERLHHVPGRRRRDPLGPGLGRRPGGVQHGDAGRRASAWRGACGRSPTRAVASSSTTSRRSPDVGPDADAPPPDAPRDPVIHRDARSLLGVVGLAVGVLAVLALREATLSTHDHVDPGSRMEVVVSARIEGAESHQTLDEMVEA